MTQSPPPADSAAPAGPVPLPWYRRPSFWGLVFFLLLLAYLLWLVWLQWSIAAAQKEAISLATQEQQARNSLWEAEAARLRAALNDDPCLVEQVLRQSPVLPAIVDGTQGMEGKAAPEARLAPQPDANQAPTPQSGANDFPPPNRSTEQAPVTASGIPALLEQATVLVLAEGEAGLSMGTGFFIAPDAIMTNHHVVGANPQRIWVINKATKGIISAKLLASSDAKGQDYAVLGVSPIAAVRPLSFNTAVQRTDRVSAWGFPNAVTADDPQFQKLLQGKGNTSPEVVYTDGVVSVILSRKPPLIVHTATVSQGNSGGPLVNAQGQVVGINTYIRLDDASYRQSSLAIMSGDVLAFLDKHRIPYTVARAAAESPAAPEAPKAAPAAPEVLKKDAPAAPEAQKKDAPAAPKATESAPAAQPAPTMSAPPAKASPASAPAPQPSSPRKD